MQQRHRTATNSRSLLLLLPLLLSRCHCAIINFAVLVLYYWVHTL
jgi:hypothetical protein